MTRPRASCARGATLETVWHDETGSSRAIIEAGLTTQSMSGPAARPASTRLVGDAANAITSSFRPYARAGQRLARLAAKIGAATLVAEALPRTSQMLIPINATSETTATVH